ncbi:MAG: hypothetical protein WA192_12635 [Candidatus Acidiferrales bacterium]
MNPNTHNPKVRVSKKRTVKMYVEMWQGSQILLRRAERDAQGNYWVAMSALLLTAFSLEALEMYASQAGNTDAEMRAMEVRMRAERRAGQLLKEKSERDEMAKGARGNPGGRGAAIVRSSEITAQETLADLGISKQQSSNWQKLAAIDDTTFESRFGKGKKVTTKGLVRESRPKPDPEAEHKRELRSKALSVWGRMRDIPTLTGDFSLRRKSGGDYTSKHSNIVLPSLPELGISKKQSSDWSSIAESARSTIESWVISLAKHRPRRGRVRSLPRKATMQRSDPCWCGVPPPCSR